MTRTLSPPDEALEWILSALDQPPARSQREQVTDRAADLFADSRGSIPDTQSEWLLSFSAAVLAVFRLLVERCASSIGRAGRPSYLESRLGVDLDEPASAFDRVVDQFIVRARDRFGPTFHYVEEDRTSEQFTAEYSGEYEQDLKSGAFHAVGFAACIEDAFVLGGRKGGLDCD